MLPDLSALARDHLDRVRAFYDSAPTEPKAGAKAYRALLAHYYNLLIPPHASVLEIGCGSGDLLSRLHAGRKVGIDLSPTQIAAARTRTPDAEFFVQAGEILEIPDRFDVIIVSDTRLPRSVSARCSIAGSPRCSSGFV